jgi:hypothetical protein
MSTKSNAPVHLVVIMHGLLGHPDKMKHLATTIAAECNSGEEEQYVVHAVRCNATEKGNWKGTLDGVIEGGKRAALETKAVIAECKDSLKYITVIGFSLGGLYARMASALLFNPADGTVGGLVPRTFLTVASPHLGVRTSSFLNWVRKAVGVVNQLSLQHLLLDDHPALPVILAELMADWKELHPDDQEQEQQSNESSSNSPQSQEKEEEDGKQSDPAVSVPLLVMMAREKQVIPFFEALASFQHHCVYANAINDSAVSFCTASVQPFEAKHLSLPMRSHDKKTYPSVHAVYEKSKGDDKHHVPISVYKDAPRYVNEDLTSATEAVASHQAEILSKLRTLDWRRVIVQFTSGNAHNLIMGNGILWNKNKGKDVALHVARYLRDLGHTD